MSMIDSKQTVPILGVVLLAMIVAFQNCGGVRLNGTNSGSASNLPLSASALTGKFCALAPSVISSEAYIKTEFSIMNLNTIMKNGRLYPDSDADGLIDSEDARPKLRRGANGRVDIVSRDYSVPESSSCTPQANSLNFFGFNSCDIASTGTAASIFDFESDGMPDFFEILRGGLVTTRDADKKTGDGIINIEKMHLGRQLYFFERDVDPLFETHFSVTEANVQDCGEGLAGYSFLAQQIPLVETLEVPDQPENTPFSHLSNENLVIVFYVARPLASAEAPTYLFASPVLKLRYGRVDSIDLKPSDFSKVGEMPSTAN